MLAHAIEPTLDANDALIVSSAGHEANIGPWVRAAQRSGATLLWWHPEGEHGEETCPLGALRSLLSSGCGRVRVVAFCHASNLLGGIVDAHAITRLARSAGALSVVDGVAFAPHRRVDAPHVGADFYALSYYKTYGPHMAALYGTHAAWHALLRAGAKAPGHFFMESTADNPAYAWEPGGVSHEACAALCGLRDYLRVLGGTDESCSDDCAVVNAACSVMMRLELPINELLNDFFATAHASGRLRLLGPRDASQRVPTFSFVPLTQGVTVSSVVAACHAARVAVRSGHMYAHRLCTRLGVQLQPAAFGTGAGVVRVSAVHYNTMHEARRCIDAIDAAL